MESNKKNSEKNKSSLKDIISKPIFKVDSKIAQYSGLGLTLAVTILIFFFIGKWIDGKAGTTVVFTLILTFTGFAAGFYSFYLNIKKLSESDKKENPKYNKF
ncbi:MAG: AtpZ/AtpI family protein [Ignavibacteria bacterium]|nr:AtpZ/AtpI family protein [Ignavibacteria bacterium]